MRALGYAAANQRLASLGLRSKMDLSGFEGPVTEQLAGGKSG
ncbi:MAG: hypothetical protein ABSC06_16815 [Rhodopila sp.]|jgi:hypothetical protein